MTEYKLQSIIFNKHLNTLEDVYNFITIHNYNIMKIDETKNYYRVRQLSPTKIKNEGYTEYIEKTIDPNKDIKFVIAYMRK
jgi:hypothetical protein